MNKESKKSVEKKFNKRGKPEVVKTSVKIAAFLIAMMCIIGNLPSLKVGAAGNITGTVFQDFNGNGTFDTAASAAVPAVDAGVTGITVTAYDSGGAARGTATTAANGTYTLAATGTGPYRLEFTTVPAGFVPSARSTNSVNGGTTTSTGSTVQFVADGNTANVNLAINRPQDFCQNNPLVCIPQHYLGNINGGSLKTFPYNYSSDIDGNINRTTTATPSRAVTELAPTDIAANDATGSLHGVAWNAATRRIFASAIVKRGAKLGTLGNESTGAIYVRTNPTAAAGATTLYVDLNTVFAGSTGANPHPIATANFADDSVTNASVGKIGLGDLEISQDGSTLYSVNLNDKRLYLIPTSGALNSTTITRFAIPTTGLTTNGGTCPTADVRPFALGRDGTGQIYVGAVCSAETAGATDAAKRPFLHAFIWRFAAGAFTLVANTTLNYTRTSAGANQPWQVGDDVSHPELMFTDIEFNRGNMIVGFRDKNGDENISGQADRGYGEILRAGANGTNFTFENNGTAGGVTTAGANTAGLGGGEYYIDLNGDNREEGVQGGLVQVPGFNHTLTTAYDAVAFNSAGTRIGEFFAAGVQRYNNTTGVLTGAYNVYLEADTGTFRKANGLGDIEVLCDSAPIELGNRVWNDVNGNGVQDPGETAIAGVTVELYNGATPVTYARYRDEFVNIAYNGTNGSVDWSGTPWTEFSDDGSVTAGDVQVTAGGGALVNTVRIGNTGNGLTRAVSLAGSSSATLSFDYLRAGQGLVAQYSTDGTNYINLQTLAAATDAVFQTASVAVPVGATNIRFVSNTAGATNFVYLDNVQISTNVVTTTDADGEYYFSSAPGTTTGANAVFDANIQPNTAYQVRFSGTPIANLIATQPNATAQNGDDAANDSNVINAAGGLRVINYTTGATAGSNDHTLDAGFVAPASVGNFVFSDLNGNGVQDAGEPGINGVTVTLYDNQGAVIATTTTTAVGGVAGQYSFTGLLPGTYSVGFTLPTGLGYAFSPADQGGDDTTDSDANAATGRTPTFTLIAGQNNTTIDAGLVQTLSLGNQVFNDANNNGIRDAAEVGIAGVTVNLYLDANNDGTPDGGIIATATTDGNGLYLFTGLAANNYIVGVVTPTGFVSSSVNGGDPDNNTDNDDNGVLIVGNETRSNPITLALTTEPTGETPTNDPNTPDNNSNLTLDFGFTPSYSLGNRIWFDTNNDGRINTGEVGISGVSIFIFASTDLTDALQTVTTDANGYYRFDNLASRSYVIRINQSNFQSGGVLFGYQNTTGNNTADLDSTNTLNGEDGINPTGAANTVQTLGISSGVIVLGGAAEPTGETDVQASGQGAPDNQANMTIDFGFYGMSLSGTIWNDNGNGTPANSNNGILNTGEPRLGGVRVQIYDSANVEIPVGPDGILGTNDDAAGGVLTNATGDYNFQGLPPGDYRVVVTRTSGTPSTPRTLDPNANVDNDNNGFPDNTGNFAGKFISGLITLTPGGEVSFVNSTGSTLNSTVDFGFVLAATAIKLDTFETFTDGNFVELKWSTGSEANNLGFNVYREVDGKRRLLNAAPIAGNALRSNTQLEASGQNYTWTDKEYVANAVYYLEDLDMNGSANLNGASAPQMRQSLDSQPNARTFADLANAGNTANVKEIVGNQPNVARTEKAKVNSADQQRKIAALGGAKIIVNHDGWYRVSAQQLAAAGFDVNSNQSLWQLYADGAEVPFKLNSDNSIEFFGRGLDTPLTDQQAYYLIKDQANGLRINQVEGGAANGNADARSFGVTVERKDRAIYVPGLLNGDESNWFGAVIGRSSQTVQNLNVFNVDGQSKTHLSIKMQGIGAANHSVSVKFNDAELGTVEFSGMENKQFEFDLPAGAVREGVNDVRLQANGESNDFSLVDAISISYNRGYTAHENRLRFTVPANQSARINGFGNADISVYELGNGAARQQIVVSGEGEESNYGFSLGAANADREMIAVVDSTVENAPVERNTPSTWNSAANQANFVIVTGSEVRESADRLAAMREAQGLKTKVVAVEDLFDEFSFGRRDPAAVREFLRTAATVWKQKPNYALLFGDSTYDSRNNLGLNVTRNVVPTKLADTDNLETSSDSWLADFDNDGAEDLALGRLPVGSAAEAAAAVEKLARFDQQSARQEKTDVLVSDRGFEDFSTTLQTILPKGINSFRVDRSAGSDAETHQRIVEQLNNNPTLVTYTGHGSQTVWAANGIFNQTDAAGLSNSQLSFYLLMNCLNGYTHQPNGDSLGESLFKSSNGAIAVWASSGVTEAGSQAAISEAFTRLAFDGSGRAARLGDVVKAAKRESNSSDVRRTWQLLGDPTVFIK